MAARERSTLGSIGERELVRLIRRWLGPACPASPFGMGDDCALLPATRGRTLITVDPVIRGKHFDETTPASAVAARLLRRNLSDIAAMGGSPRHAVVALAAPPHTPLEWMRSFHRKLGREAVRFGVSIVGGDCTSTDGLLGAFLTLTGVAPEKPLTRDGARAGDRLYVSGTLGGSLFGSLRITPRLDEGRWLADQKGVRAAIDLSDGLGKDLPRLLPERTAAVLNHRAIPISAAARKAADDDGRSALDHSINDGEDYELLFAIAPGHADRIEREWRRSFATRLSCIGRLERAADDGAQVGFESGGPTDVTFTGYEHFR